MSCLQFEIDWLVRNGGSLETIRRVIARYELEWQKRLEAS